MNIMGLFLNFVGAVLIFFFGLPPRVREGGESYLLLETGDEDEIRKGKKYRKISKLGLILLATGFLLQILEQIL